MRAGHIDDADVHVVAVAAAVAASAVSRHRAPVLRGVASGWRNNPSQLHLRCYDSPLGELRVGYALGGHPRFEVNGEPLDDVTVVSVAGDRVVLVVDGVRRTFVVHLVGDEIYVDTPRGGLALRAQARFPQTVDKPEAGSLVAPMPGTVVSVEVAVGDEVVAGQLLAVLEAMRWRTRSRAGRRAGQCRARDDAPDDRRRGGDGRRRSGGDVNEVLYDTFDDIAWITINRPKPATH